ARRSAVRPVPIPTRDGRALAGRRFDAAGGAPAAIVVVAAAMGVPQRYYAPFADWLARERGCTVLTFDYRGIGESAPPRLAGFDATLTDWYRLDLDAALRAARVVAAPPVPLTVVGHSLGGQIAPLAPSVRSIDALLTVAAGSGWWRQTAAPTRA